MNRADRRKMARQSYAIDKGDLMTRRTFIAVLVLMQLASSATPALAKRSATTLTSTAPYGASAESTGSCPAPSICSSSIDLRTGEIRSTLVTSSSDGTTKVSSRWRAFQDSFDVTRAHELTVGVEVKIDQADCTSSVLGAATAASSIVGGVMMWSPQSWSADSPVTTLSQAANGSNEQAPAGVITLSFTHRPVDATNGYLGVEVWFRDTARADSASGGTASASTNLRLTVQSITLTYR